MLSPDSVSPVMVTVSYWLVREIDCGDSSVYISATMDSGTVPPVAAGSWSVLSASRSCVIVSSPAMVTSYSSPFMRSVVAVEPVISPRTSEPMVAAFRPKRDAFSRSILIATRGT